MHGSVERLYRYMEGSSKRFIIPVYQRNYDWKIEQCKQLFDDLVKIEKNKSETHFFGSMVSTSEDQLGMEEFLIIDGQQRLTTVSLMLLALHDLIVQEKITTEDKSLTDKIKNEFLVDKYSEENTRIKLKPVKNDAEAYAELVDDAGNHVRASNITINYNYFYNRIQKKEVSARSLFDSFLKLEVINIYLGEKDNPQLIFESLNSTGLDLSEGDKIRNYILMDVKPTKKQEHYYEKYWHRIELYTNYNVSAFVRDYLSIKMQSTPTMKKVYLKFKEYVDTDPFSEVAGENLLAKREALMEDLLSYARRYEMLLKANSEYNQLNSVINRLNKFEATVTRPFLMEAIKHSENEIQDSSNMSKEDLLRIFTVVESYIFRRQMSDIPTNALNKIFVSLNAEIIRYDGSTENYFEKMKYALLKKTASGIFPDDGMFAEGLENKQIYSMQSKNKKYIMERFENYGTKEVKDVWNLIDEGTYSIEHIMPQTLNNEWKNELGQDYELIHEQWVDKLANLTLTAYNSSYSNNSFDKKKTMKNGFCESGLRMNQVICNYNKWTEEELEDRSQILVERGLNIWAMIETSYEPIKKTMDSMTLADEIDLTGRKVSKISLLGIEHIVNNWTDAYTAVISSLHLENPKIIFDLLTEKQTEGLNNYVSESATSFRSYREIEEEVYLDINTNTNTKISLLRKFFEEYDVEEEELIFYLADETLTKDESLNSSQKLRLEFWTHALPILKVETDRFQNITPNTDSWSSTFIGHSGINISTTANLDNLRVELYIGKKHKQANNDIFAYIKESKNIIEEESKHKFEWVNNDEKISAKIGLNYEDKGISNKENWDECIKFFSDGINIISNHLLPILDEYYNTKGM